MMATLDPEPRMAPWQGRIIGRTLDGMGITPESEAEQELMWRINAHPHAWQWRALTAKQADALIEILHRYLEAGTVPDGRALPESYGH